MLVHNVIGLQQLIEMMQKIMQHAKEHHGRTDIPVEKVQAAIKEQ